MLRYLVALAFVGSFMVVQAAEEDISFESRVKINGKLCTVFSRFNFRNEADLLEKILTPRIIEEVHLDDWDLLPRKKHVFDLRNYERRVIQLAIRAPRLRGTIGFLIGFIAGGTAVYCSNTRLDDQQELAN